MVTVALVGLMDNSQVKIKDVIKIFNFIAENDTNITEISSTNKKYILIRAPFCGHPIVIHLSIYPRYLLRSISYLHSPLPNLAHSLEYFEVIGQRQSKIL